MKLSGLFLSLVFIAGCAASHAAPQKPWRVELASSGGIAGRGMGTYALTSDGNVAVTRTNGTPCTFRLTDEELRGFEEKVLAPADPAAWKASYVPENACCDRFEYALTWDEAGRVTQTKWIDDPLPMPPGLEALVSALVHGETSVRALADERCR